MAAPTASKKALVLSGGGARGAYEAGVIWGLTQAGETFDIVCGTSIGSINGSFVAEDRLQQLYDLWHTIAQYGVITLDPQVQKLKSIVTEVIAATHDPVLKRAGDIMHLLADVVGLGPPSRLLALLGALQAQPIEKILATIVDVAVLKRDLVVSATNLTRSTSDVFYWFKDDVAAQAFVKAQESDVYPLTAANFATAVQASAAIPGAFAPVDIGVGDPATTCCYVDGGVANNTPIGQAIDAGATEVTAIFMDPVGQPVNQPIQNLAQVALSCFSVMQQKILALDMQIASNTNDAIRAGRRTDKRLVTIRSVRPDKPLAVTVLQFDNQPLIDQAFADGVEDARTNLKIESAGQ